MIFLYIKKNIKLRLVSVYTGYKGGAFLYSYVILLERSAFMNKFIFISESVTSGHPDNVCDIISDSVLDSYLEKAVAELVDLRPGAINRKI